MKKNLITITITIIIVFTFLGITGTLRSGYHFVDDHEVIRIKADLKTQSTLDVAKKWMKDDLAIRFRPLYYFLRVIETKIFGSDFTIWSVFNGFLACLTFLLFYFSLLKLDFNVLESITFIVISFVGPQMPIWWRLGPSETIGVTFLALSFFFMIKGFFNKYYQLYNFLFLFFMLCASLCKESFIIIIPAMVIFKILYEKQLFNLTYFRAVYKNIFSGIIVLVMFAEIYIILKYIGTNQVGYAGVDSSIINTLKSIIKTLTNMYKIFNFLLLLCVIFFFIGFIFPKKFPKPQISAFLLFLLIFLPNLVLNAKYGFYERYLIPSTIGIAFFIVSSIKNLNEELTWNKKALLVLILITFLPYFKSSYTEAKAFAAEGLEIKSLVNEIDKNYKKDSNVLIVVDPVSFYEQSYSFKMFLSLERNIDLYGFALNKSKDDEAAVRLTAGWNSYYNERLLENMKSPADLIIFLEKDLINDFFKESGLNKEDYSGNLLNKTSKALLKSKI